MDEHGTMSINFVAKAFDVCRARKEKCDKGKPSCGFYQENYKACNYQSMTLVKYCYATTLALGYAKILKGRPCKPSNVTPIHYSEYPNAGLAGRPLG